MRKHWAIEDRLHHVPSDVTLGGDASRIRCNPGVLASLRHIGLNLMCSNGERNISLRPFTATLSTSIASFDSRPCEIHFRFGPRTGLKAPGWS